MVVPVVWKSQLFVFWASTVQKKGDDNRGQTTRQVADHRWADHALFDVEVTLNWGEFYRGKWTSPKSSEMTDPLRITGGQLVRREQAGDPAHTEQPGGNLSERLVMPVLYLAGGETAAFRVTFTSKNSAPLSRTRTRSRACWADPVKLFNFSLFWAAQTEAMLDTNSLRLTDRTVRGGGQAADQRLGVAKAGSRADQVRVAGRRVLRAAADAPDRQPVEAPFFYSDEHSMFSVDAREDLGTTAGSDLRRQRARRSPSTRSRSRPSTRTGDPGPRRSGRSRVEPRSSTRTSRRSSRTTTCSSSTADIQRRRPCRRDRGEVAMTARLPQRDRQVRRRHRRAPVGSCSGGRARRRLRGRDPLPPVRRRADRAAQPRRACRRCSTPTTRRRSRCRWRRRVYQPRRRTSTGAFPKHEIDVSDDGAVLASTTGSCSSTRR